MTRSCGPRGFFSPASPFSPLGALSPFCGCPLPPGWACLPLPAASAFGALSAFSDLPPLAFPALSSFSAIDLYSRALGKAHLAACIALADELEPDAGGLAVLRIGQ